MNWDTPHLSWVAAKMKKQSGQQRKGGSGHLYEQATAIREEEDKCRTFDKKIDGVLRETPKTQEN